jgi:hypothetical protein
MTIIRFWALFTALLFVGVYGAREFFGLKKLGQKQLTSVYFIGDLHADVGCAKQWVDATRLIDISESPYKWTGGSDEVIVFMGDYVDKGSSSSSVLSFVRELQETFPDNVITLLGNHDFFLILDTALEFNKNNPHPLGHPFYEYVYSFMHVEEYVESEFTTKREDDEELLGAILQGLQHAYDLDKEGQLYLCAPNCQDESQIDLFTAMPPFVDDQILADRYVFHHNCFSISSMRSLQHLLTHRHFYHLQHRAKKRLEIWRKQYAEGLYQSGLLAWLIKQPLVAQVGDALVVHGGVSENLIKYIEYNNGKGLENGMNVTYALNQVTNEAFAKFFERHQSDMIGANTIQGRDFEGISFEAILDMVQHRGYFKQNGCKEVNNVLTALGGKDAGFTRVVVGHTPFDYAAQHCDGQLLAADSSLSRPFRAHGNLYCPLSKSLNQYKGNKSCASYHNDICEGSITRMRRSSAEDPWPKDMEIMSLDELILTTAMEISGDVHNKGGIDGKDEL